MKTTTLLASIMIDGQKLKDVREASGKSIAEIAVLLTLSNEQVKYIEEGGEKPFYSQAHKLLAVRKYAKALGIPFEEVIIEERADQTLATPNEAPTESYVPVSSQSAIAADLRLAPVTRNAEIRRQIMIVVAILCVSLAVYAKVRGSYDDNSQTQEQSADLVGMPVYESKNEPVAVAATVNEPVATPAAELKDAAPVAPVASASSASDGDCPKEQAGADIKSWSPSYQRKPDSRLFVMSPRGESLCITDVSGKTKRYALKPMVGQIIPGKAPYTVRSDNLAQVEMYLQGLRVKVPLEANALRLLPTHNTSQQPSEQSAALPPEL
jgi:cytoskeletal protein RodZ